MAFYHFENNHFEHLLQAKPFSIYITILSKLILLIQTHSP